METTLAKTPVSQSKLNKKSKKSKNIASADVEILTTLGKLKSDLEFLNNSYDNITEPALIDSCAYEILAIKMKYKYYLSLCKERGLIAEGF